MILEELTIGRPYWGNAEPLRGKIKFKGQNGTVELNLSEEMAQKLLAVVAEGVVESAKEVATRLTSDVINAQALRLAKPAEAEQTESEMPF